MKVKVYSDETKPEVILKLYKDGDGVMIAAVDHNGYVISNLCWISEDGLYLSTGVSPKLGLPLSDGDRVKVRED